MQINIIQMYNKDIAGTSARVCYSPKSYNELSENSELSTKVLNHCTKSGHHSVLDHAMVSLELRGIPKLLAMMLNNTGAYNTSERSGRYTRMSKDNENYNTLLEMFTKLITSNEERLETKENIKRRLDEKTINKLAMENARYCLSILHPTDMIFTISVRNLCYIYYTLKDHVDNFDTGVWDEKFRTRYCECVNELVVTLENDIIEMIKQDGLYVEPKESAFIALKDKLFFTDTCYEYDLDEESFLVDFHRISYTYFGKLSAVALAQNQRHRTVPNKVFAHDFNENYGEKIYDNYYIPSILEVSGNEENLKVYKGIMDSVYKDGDLPQGHLFAIVERGAYSDLYAKSLERLCSRAQLEIQNYTIDLVSKINNNKLIQKLKCDSKAVPRCKNHKCLEPCKYGINGLNRLY